MGHTILFENQKKRSDYPFWMLFCFALFNFWQMGFIYFLGPALSVNGRTPLPISVDNITVLIALAYVCSILLMSMIPQYIIKIARITTFLSLITAVGLFLPLPDDVLRLLIYISAFLCCVMIGFETFVMTNFFSEQSTITHLTAAYAIALAMIALIQSDFMPITFSTFRVTIVIALILLLVFYVRMPGKTQDCPRYVKKSDAFSAPKKLLIGTFIIVFVASLMGVSGPSISEEVEHGIFIMYTTDAIAGFFVYFLYRKVKIHPIRSISVCISLGGIGFLLMFVATHVPVLAYISCALIGFGMLACQMLPLYGVILMKSYPSRFLSPIIIGLALVAVLVQSTLVEMFRTAPTLLYLVYAIIMVILVIIYLQAEPYFLYTLHRKIPEIRTEETEIGDETIAETGDEATQQVSKEKTLEIREEKLETITPTTEQNIVNTVEPSISKAATISPELETAVTAEKIEDKPKSIPSPLGSLTKRELEVVDLIGYGYSNADIAKILFISVHTVNDHTKNVYRKMNVHSRFELTALVNRLKSQEQE